MFKTCKVEGVPFIKFRTHEKEIVLNVTCITEISMDRKGKSMCVFTRENQYFIHEDDVREIADKLEFNKPNLKVL